MFNDYFSPVGFIVFFIFTSPFSEFAKLKTKKRSIRDLENFHILLWLLKDTCWVLGLKTLGVIMIVPTVGMAIIITWRSRKIVVDLYHNLAVLFWITANSLWMFGELFYDGTSRQDLYENYRMIAVFLFVIGLLCVSWFYVRLAFKKYFVSSKK